MTSPDRRPYRRTMTTTAGTRQAAARAVALTKTYGQGAARVVALDGVTLEVYAGEFTAVMGPSGSGKSTLLHCLAGLDEPSSGEVFVGEVALGTLRDDPLTALRRDRIGFVFQAYNLVPTLTARENICLPQDIAGRRVDTAWFDEVVEAVGLGDRLRHRPAELSGGQQQRVACARALLGRPDLLVADEPTGNLDSVAGGEILAFLRHCVDGLHQTVVMVTHDPVAAGYTDRVVFLADGRLVDELRAPSAADVAATMTGLTRAATPGRE